MKIWSLPNKWHKTVDAKTASQWEINEHNFASFYDFCITVW
jgi:hypothetical protein